MPLRARKLAQAKGRREWIGGRLVPPFFMHDREEPYRPEVVAWMDLPSGLVVGADVIAPEDAHGAVGRVLLAAIERPLAGLPGRPDAIRVAHASLAAEVRAAVGDAIPITIGPTPELDEILEAILDSMPADDEDESYLEGGCLSPGDVGALFASAVILYRTAPWKVAGDQQVVRMDIPALGVEGACVSIIGRLGKSIGFLVFPSLAGFEAFASVAEDSIEEGGRLDLGTDWLSLTFDRGADIPASMRREIVTHGWPVAGSNAYPRIARHDPDGTPRPLTPHDLKIASACATSLTAFFIKHRPVFEADAFEPVCESYYDGDDLEVRFTWPYEALPLFDTGGPAVVGAKPNRLPRSKTNRNAPCPCGSGLKYKKCCLPLADAQRPAAAGRDASHDLDGRLIQELTEFAMANFPFGWRRHTRDFANASSTLQLSVPWSLYHYHVDGATVLDRFLAAQDHGLTREERAWLAAQRAAWISVWEVTQVEPGTGMTLRDLLSGEVRQVREVSGSRTLVVRDALLARVVDHDGVSFLDGVHHRPLPPYHTAEVVRRVRVKLRRKRAVPVERLRDEGFGRFLIARWEGAVRDLDAQHARVRVLQNTDGDPLLLTTDRFDIATGTRPAIAPRLAALEGVEPPDPGVNPSVYVFLRPGNAIHPSWDNTVIGHARLSDTALQLETNSLARADALRSRVEAACGEHIRHRGREHEDPKSQESARSRRGRAPKSRPSRPAPEAEQLVMELKRSHYADWPDQSLPALDGKTPREAVKTASGRAAVDVLLKEMENQEQRSAGGVAFDFTAIRRKLRLE